MKHGMPAGSPHSATANCRPSRSVKRCSWCSGTSTAASSVICHFPPRPTRGRSASRLVLHAHMMTAARGRSRVGPEAAIRERAMQLGVVLAPIGDPPAVVAAARAAEEAGLDAVALWDHVHSLRPDWPYAAGWSVWGAIAQATERVRLVPMVLNGLLHDPGRLAKEVAMLDLLSGGRFELAIGLGDWPESSAAWGVPFPPLDERIARLRETLEALDALWRGEAVTRTGSVVRLDGAVSSPVPASRIRIVVGAGSSHRVMRELGPLADELNVYREPALMQAARDVPRRSAAPPAVSVHVDWSWDKWPADPAGDLAALGALGVDRAFVAIGAADVLDRIARLARA